MPRKLRLQIRLVACTRRPSVFHKMRRKSVKQLQSMREVLGQYERVSVSNIDELLESINSDLNDLKKTAKEQVLLSCSDGLTTDAVPVCLTATTNSVRGGRCNAMQAVFAGHTKESSESAARLFVLMFEVGSAGADFRLCPR